MLPAARVTDMHTCPMWTGVVPHVGGPVLPPGAVTVLIGKMPAARMGDPVTCAGPPDAVLTGVPTLLIGKKPAARMTDLTAHGGVITLGCATVLLGGAAPPPPPPPPPPPADLTPDEVAFMKEGHTADDLAKRRKKK
jgi:uncharacterized Zn-binding protein involved in type VI secretion